MAAARDLLWVRALVLCARNTRSLPMKTLALRTLIGSIALSALVGIYILLVGNMGDLEVRVLLTSLSISALSILAMACGVAYERGRLAPLPLVGAATSGLSFVLFMIGIWGESEAETLWKSAVTTLLIGAASAHTCLLSLAALAPRFRWSRGLGAFCAFALAALLSLMIWAELDNQGLFRTVGVLAIGLGAVTIAVPVLHRMSAGDSPPAAAVVEGPARFCVGCGHAITGDADPMSCGRCGTRFRVELLP